MKFLLIGIGGFLVVAYIFAYKKRKKNKSENISTVDYFNEKYSKVIHSARIKQSSEAALDYVEKNEFVKEIQKELEKKETSKTIKKRMIL